MRAVLVLTTLVLAAQQAAAAQPLEISFQAPAEAEGDVSLSGTWAIIEFQPSSQPARFLAQVQTSVNFTYVNHTWWSYDDQLGDHVEQLLTSDEEGWRHGSLNDFTATWAGVGFLGIRATSIELHADQAALDIRTLESKEINRLASAGGNGDAFSPWVADSALDQVVVSMIDHSVRLEIIGMTAIEFLGATIECGAGICPLGGTWSTTTAPNSRIDVMSFERITGLGGQAHLDGHPLRVRVGGPSLDANMSGAMRMPQAQVPAACLCPLDGDATLALQGTFALKGLRATSPGHLSGTVSGEGVQAFSDGKSFVLLPFAAVSVAATGVFVLAIATKFLFILFTRLSKQEALEHPKRQQIFHYIQEHPGANFREIARNTRIASGTVRHHLTVLERSGHVVEHQHQGTVRLFENHGKFDHNWADLVLLREPPLAKLHDWLKHHPASPQKLALEAMEMEGWSRSTTQHRLARLVHGGLATIRLQGRLKIYSVAERPAPSRSNGLVATAGTT